MYNGIPSDVYVSFTADVEIALKIEVSPIVQEKYVIPLIFYISLSRSLQCLVVAVVSVIVKFLLCCSWVFIGSKEDYQKGGFVSGA